MPGIGRREFLGQLGLGAGIAGIVNASQAMAQETDRREQTAPSQKNQAPDELHQSILNDYAAKGLKLLESNDTVQEYTMGIAMLLGESLANIHNNVNRLRQRLIDSDADRDPKRTDQIVKGSKEYLKAVDHTHVLNAEILALTMTSLCILIPGGFGGRFASDHIAKLRKNLSGERLESFKALTNFNLQSVSLISLGAPLKEMFRDKVILPYLRKQPKYIEACNPIAILPWKEILGGSQKVLEQELKDTDAQIAAMKDVIASKQSRHVGKRNSYPKALLNTLQNHRTLYELGLKASAHWFDYIGANSGFSRCAASIGRQLLQARAAMQIAAPEYRDQIKPSVMSTCVSWPPFFALISAFQAIPGINKNIAAEMLGTLAIFIGFKFTMNQEIQAKYHTGNMNQAQGNDSELRRSNHPILKRVRKLYLPIVSRFNNIVLPRVEPYIEPKQ